MLDATEESGVGGSPQRNSLRSRLFGFLLELLKYSLAQCFSLPNPHRSFAPVRTTIPCSWFVDGATYMSAVADAIENAREEVFITDWWLSPEIYMKRPAICGDHWRLDSLLKRKAVSRENRLLHIFYTCLRCFAAKWG